MFQNPQCKDIISHEFLKVGEQIEISDFETMEFEAKKLLSLENNRSRNGDVQSGL